MEEIYTEKEILGAALAQKNIKDAQSNPKAGSVENNKPAVPEWLKNLWKLVSFWELVVFLLLKILER